MDPTILTDLTTTFSNLWYLWGIIAFVPSIIMGIFTSKLAKKKGYRGYFFTGFFFNLVGLIYVVGLPMAKDSAV
ncbi:MAG: hypothetical protein Q8S22_02480 [Eubacteriales bacterium]|jgi:archaellum biogenesis protein FlaJ (TadC family)|nr:hypothetical protein [Eubacteriales bacterium]